MKVFVYGTLKRGFGNHRVMEHAKGYFIGDTKIKGSMYSLHAFPAITLGSDSDSTVSGEVFEVPDENIDILDSLEGHPTFYQRVETETEFGPTSVYVMDQDSLARRGALERKVESGIWEKYRRA